MINILKKSYVFLMFMLLSVNTAQAAVVNFSTQGVVDQADAGNAFSLMSADFVSATGTFEDTGFTGIGQESLSISTLTMDIGLFTFTQADAIDPALTEIVFLDGSLLGFNFFTVSEIVAPGINFDSTFDTFIGEDENINLVLGTWDSTSYTVVPVPAAIWLFGSGLLGLVGFIKYRQKH